MQYQRTETLTETREYWSRNLDMTYMKRLSPDLQLAGQFRINALDYVDRPERSFTPYGSLQLTHRIGGFNASYRPYSVTNSNEITTHQKDAQFTGFLAPPRLPRFDMQWTRRRQEPGDRVPAGTGITRSGRLSHLVGGFDLRAGAGDLVLLADDTNRAAGPRSRTGTRGSAIGSRGGAGTCISDADFSRGPSAPPIRAARIATRRAPGCSSSPAACRRASTRTSPTSTAPSTTGQGAGFRDYVTHDGAATWNLRPTRATQLIVGGGVRPVTMTSGVTRTLGYLLFSGDGRRAACAPAGRDSPRRPQTVNRNPDGRSYWVGSYRAGSRLHPGAGIEHGRRPDRDRERRHRGAQPADDHGGDRWAWRQIPCAASRLRGICGTIGRARASAQSAARSYRASFDIRWQPWNGYEVGVNVARSGALPKGVPC